MPEAMRLTDATYDATTHLQEPAIRRNGRCVGWLVKELLSTYAMHSHQKLGHAKIYKCYKNAK